ncbi:MAG TPA: methyltransferase domain-containing protein [Pseudoxanthomonas sp.]|nr:methyltransferase domain-containing protein [Pseudoxanthomonas sp.]
MEPDTSTGFSSPSTGPLNAEPWSRLWKAGILHSCATGIAGNYDGTVRSFWHGRFASLADGQCLVDIGTGNGAVPLLAKDYAETRGILLDIHGVDIADIDPVASAPGGSERYAGIQFHPCTSATALPFAAGEVSLLCSQFAFEYVPRDQAIAEIVRVIGPNGRAALVMHSDQSIVAQVGEQQLQGCSYLLDESDFLKRAAALARVLSQAPDDARRAALAQNPHAEITRHEFNDSARALMEKISELEVAEVLKKAAQQISSALQLAGRSGQTALAIIESARAALQDEQARLLQLRSALVDEEALAAIRDGFQAAGFSVHCSPLYYRDNIRLGWTMVVGNE